jgi:hypothetical protein
VSAQEPAIVYLASIFALAAGGGLAIRGAYLQAALLVVGGLFLIYWGRRLAKDRGER